MTRQEINLLIMEPAIRAPKLCSSVVLMIAAIFSLLLIGFSWYGEQQLNAVYADIQEIEKNNQNQQKVIVRADGVDRHQSKLKLLESQLLSKYQLWSDYKSIAKSGSQGFSKHFYHIASLSDENISLYEIEIYDKGSRLAMKGYARQASHIPSYINKLKGQKEFNKVAFGDLSIEKLKGHEVMRFSLDKYEEDPVKPVMPKKRERIDISKLMNMTLSDIDTVVSSKDKNFRMVGK